MATRGRCDFCSSIIQFQQIRVEYEQRLNTLDREDTQYRCPEESTARGRPKSSKINLSDYVVENFRTLLRISDLVENLPPGCSFVFSKTPSIFAFQEKFRDRSGPVAEGGGGAGGAGPTNQK